MVKETISVDLKDRCPLSIMVIIMQSLLQTAAAGNHCTQVVVLRRNIPATLLGGMTPICLQNYFNSVWHRLDKVLETFLRDFGHCRNVFFFFFTSHPLSSFGEPLWVVVCFCSCTTGAALGLVFFCCSPSGSRFDRLCIQRWYSADFGYNKWLFDLLLSSFSLPRGPWPLHFHPHNCIFFNFHTVVEKYILLLCLWRYF